MYYQACIGGIDDGFFNKSWKYTSAVLAIHCYKDNFLCPCKVYLDRFTVDGMDATDVIVSLAKKALRNISNLRMLLLDTPIFAGFNVAEPWSIYDRTSIPVVVVVWYQPNRDAVERALRLHFEDWKVRLAILDRVWRDLKKVICPRGELFIATYGVDYISAWKEICKLQLYTRQPEPLYTAHMFASIVSKRGANILRAKQ